jgi:hypothetical protein
MARSSTMLVTLVATTSVAQIALGAAWIQIFADVDPDGSGPAAFLYGPASALSGIALPFLLGYIVGRRGFLLGALVGLLVGPCQLLLVAHNFPSLGLAPQLLSSAIGSAITCAVASAAGVLAKGLGSNNSFKPKPLRGSA